MILGYVWNELQKNPKAQRKLSEFMMEASTKPCLFLVLEPANQNLARNAMELRDDMCLSGFPLSFQLKPMSNARKAKDWCYSESTWKVPTLIADLDKFLEINRQD